MNKGAGCRVLVEFLLQDHDPERAGRTVQDFLEPLRRRSSYLGKTPRIVSAERCAEPDADELARRENPLIELSEWLAARRILRLAPGGRDRGA